MKKYVYTLSLARIKDPYERAIFYHFDSAEAVLAELIATAKIHGYKYPASTLMDIAKSVNKQTTTVECVTRFYRSGGITGEHSAAYIPHEVLLRPLYDVNKRGSNKDVTITDLMEVSA